MSTLDLSNAASRRRYTSNIRSEVQAFPRVTALGLLVLLIGYSVDISQPVQFLLPKRLPILQQFRQNLHVNPFRPTCLRLLWLALTMHFIFRFFFGAPPIHGVPQGLPLVFCSHHCLPLSVLK